MMIRAGKTYRILYLYLIALCTGFLFASCGASKKATKDSYKQTLSDEERTTFKSIYYQAAAKKILGDYDESVSLFKQCLNIDPTSAAANYEIADILTAEADKSSDSAIIYSKRATELEPTNVWYEGLYAQCLISSGNYKAAEGVYQNLINEHPFVRDYYYKLALIQLKTGQLEQAAQTYQLAEQKAGFNEDVAVNVVAIYERAKKYTEAEKEIQELIQYNPDIPQYYDMLGNLYDMQGDSDKAFAVYKEMAEKYPDDPMARLSLADYYRAHHNDKMAFEELKSAFEQSSLDLDTKRRILLTNFYGVGLGTDSITQQGIILCQLMVKADPKESGSHVTYGDFLLRNLEVTKALEQYNIAAGIDSSNYIVWEKILTIYNQLNKYSALAKTSKTVIGLFPDYPFPYLMNGFANFQLKQYNESISSLRQGIAYVTDDTTTLGEFYALLGDVNNSIKNYTASDSAYSQALKLNPDNDEVLNNYSYYLSLRGTNLAMAADMSKKSNELFPTNYTYEDTYAWILYKSGQYQEAESWENKAIQHGGAKDNDILEHYGDILFKLNNKKGAIEYWQKALDGGAKSKLLQKEIADKQLYEK